MGFLGRNKDKEQQAQPEQQPIETGPCPHNALSQRWDEPQDMGVKEKATYVCEACGDSFNYDQARQILEHPAVPPALEEVGSQTR
jgi:hypothetical protein